MLAVALNLTFQDAKKKKSFTKIYFPVTFSFSQYMEAAVAAAQVFANLSTAQITEVSLGIALDLSAADLKTVATQFSDIFTKALVLGRSIIGNMTSRFKIPTFDDANTIDGSDVLDIVDTDVQALYTLIEDGLDDGGIAIRPVTARDQSLDTVTAGAEMFRKS